jgi:putative ABC transport system ATP-binding protein
LTDRDIVLEARSLVLDRRGDAGPARVLDGVDLALRAGTLTDMVGQSGAGKTTLLLALARLLPDVRGELLLDGVLATSVAPRDWRTQVTYLPQRSSLLGGSVRNDLLFPWRLAARAGRPAPSDADLRTALDSVRLHDIGLDREVARLSEGQSARIALLRAVLTKPRVLLLDEPDASLDDESASQVTAVTKRFVDDGGAVVRVRHLRGDALADRRYRLASGRLTEEATR